jgi:hypothetical protein
LDNEEAGLAQIAASLWEMQRAISESVTSSDGNSPELDDSVVQLERRSHTRTLISDTLAVCHDTLAVCHRVRRDSANHW